MPNCTVEWAYLCESRHDVHGRAHHAGVLVVQQRGNADSVRNEHLGRGALNALEDNNDPASHCFAAAAAQRDRMPMPAMRPYLGWVSSLTTLGVTAVAISVFISCVSAASAKMT